jgi:ankyrin repeat protein
MINVGTLEHMTPLHFAAGSEKGMGAVEFLGRFTPAHGQHLLTVNSKDKWKRTPLHIAVKYCRTMVVHELVRMGADPTASDVVMRTPLHYAVISGDYKSMACLLQQQSVTPDVMDANGWTPLHYAAHLGREEFVTYLLTHDVKPANCEIKDKDGRTPHFLACLSGSPEALKALTCHRIIDDLDHCNRSLLHYACSSDSPVYALQCLEFLFDLSIDVSNTSDVSDRRESANSALNGSLVSFYDINLKDCDGRTPLILASEHDSSGKLVDYLIMNGAEIDVADNNGLYAINYAAAAGNHKSLQTLLKTHYWNDTVFTKCPAQCAARYGHAECLDLLLNDGIYDDLAKCLELSRREASSDCYEVLEAFINTLDQESLAKEDDSIAEMSKYYTASDSFHKNFLDASPDSHATLSKTVSDLSKISLNDTFNGSDEEHVRLFSEEGTPSPENRDDDPEEREMSPLPSYPMTSESERAIASKSLSFTNSPVICSTNGCVPHLKTGNPIVNGISRGDSLSKIPILTNGYHHETTVQEKIEPKEEY